MSDKRPVNGPAVQSMTGYALRSDNQTPQLTVELRGVNSRFLDLVMKMPDELRALEPQIRDLLRDRVRRGKLECRLSLQTVDSTATLAPNPSVLHALKTTLAQLQTEIPGLEPPSAAQLLNFPGLFTQPLEADQLSQRLLDLTSAALDDFIQSRETEGARLALLIEQRLAEVNDIANTIKRRSPEIMAVYQARLTEKIRQSIESVADPARLDEAELVARVSQEAAVYGLRIDVAEEIDRLLAHVQECRDRLSGPGPVGKRLDFLMQELNREANTLGSKASAIDMTQAAVDLKVLIEQIREQVQNLE
ncbi:MAG: YicC/YloC family endoribonuclease [Burkholderiaceae bacterium]